MENMPGSQKPWSGFTRYPAAPHDAWPFRWRTRKEEAARFGQPCRIVAQRKNFAYGWHSEGRKVTVEFEDGVQITTSRGSIRRRNRS